jgi:hypothetical protein
MNPQNPQFDGQSEALDGLPCLQRAADKYDADVKAEGEAFNVFLSSPSGHTSHAHSVARIKTEDSGDNLRDLVMSSPTDHLVQVLNSMGPDHKASWISVALSHKDDFTPEQQHQLVMSPNPSVSHHASQDASPEIRAIHKLLHGDCKDCD